MSMPRRSLGDATLRDLTKGARRYLPFLVAVGAVILVVAFLPGKPASNSGSPGGPVTVGRGSASGSGGQSASGASGANGVNGVTGASGVSSGSGGSGGGGGGGTVTGTGAAAAGGSTTGAATFAPPQATSDPFCNKTTGRTMIPSVYAAPCEPPYNGNNGGATYQGVTATTITVAYEDPGPGGSAEVAALNAAANNTDTTAQEHQTTEGYLDMFEHHVQTYGRKIKIDYFLSSYNTSDPASAQQAECQADATTVAKQLKVFAFIGGPGVCPLNSFEQTLANDGVLCFCTVTIPNTYYLQWAPYVWGTGLPDEEQAYLMRAEIICDEIAPYPPKYAGEADLNAPLSPKRSFGLLWPGSSAVDPTDIYHAGADFFVQKLKECGVTLREDDSFPLVDPNGPADAAVIMSKFKSVHITDVIFVGDPIDPIYLTTAANKETYFPEWIQTGSAATDTTHEGRTYDQTEWAHNFGISFFPDRVPQPVQDPYLLYYWQFHHGPPAQVSYNLYEPAAFWFTTGVSMAGPDLTPRTFQCGEPPYTSKTHSGWLGSTTPVACVGQSYKGIFGYPISPTNYQQRISNEVISWGAGLWPWDDYNLVDDGALIYWDGNTSGPDESNAQGKGEYRYLYGGKRYSYGQFPKGAQPWFNPAGTVTVFSSVPAADAAPSYPNQCYYLCSSPGY